MGRPGAFLSLGIISHDGAACHRPPRRFRATHTPVVFWGGGEERKGMASLVVAEGVADGVAEGVAEVVAMTRGPD